VQALQPHFNTPIGGVMFAIDSFTVLAGALAGRVCAIPHGATIPPKSEDVPGGTGGEEVEVLGSSPSVQAVVPTAEGEVEPLDGSAQVGLQGFNLQMIMISHQHESMKPQVKPRRHTLEQLQEMLVCIIVRKQLPVSDSTIEYVIPTVLHSNAQGTTP
jgi:hypothetical protein